MIYHVANNPPPQNVPIWGCAYTTTNSEKNMMFVKQPVLGIIISNMFYEFKKDGTPKCEKSGVNIWSRSYADTEEESTLIFNDKVWRQINKLKTLIEGCEVYLIEGEI